MIDRRIRQDPGHRLHRRLLGDGRIARLYDHLSPLIKLFVDVDLHRTYIGAGSAKRGSEGKICIFLHVQVGRQDRTDRPRDSSMIAMPAAPAIYRTGIETGRTTDTFQGTPEIFSTQVYAPAIVHYYDMHFLTGTRLLQLAGIGAVRLSS